MQRIGLAGVGASAKQMNQEIMAIVKVRDDMVCDREEAMKVLKVFGF